MKPPRIGAIDCDIHPALPALSSLLPYLSDHWREMALQSGLHELETVNYPPGAPLTARQDWRPAQGKAASALAQVTAQALDPWDTSLAICNCLYGVQALFSEDLAAGIARALNSWIAREWLDLEPRLRASIVIPMQSPELAVDEIEFWASDKRFVQVLMLVTGDAPLGRRQYWPIYAAAARHGLPVGIHAGSSFRYPMTPVGWTSYYAEDYVNQSQAFQTQLTSLICEGAFSKYPELRVVLLESGFTWLPAHVWHLSKFWRGLRMEVPWVDRPPFEIVRDQVRLTLQPVDAPPRREVLERVLEHMGSDKLLLYSTDYPHWQFDGEDALPDGLSDALVRKILIDNPREAYPRVMET
ncbi:MAG: amidohydrolase, partial [Hyphomicrobiales bacterium]|nr:amidohydrolase [Hyphomicrobiales bacterium]